MIQPMFNHRTEASMSAAPNHRTHTVIHRDTRAWQLQVWVSFGIAVFLCATGLLATCPARAQSEASAALSLMPLASVVGAASVGSAAVGAVVALPAALSVGGAVLTVKAVESTARGTVLVLERASDGAVASVELAGRAASGLAVGVGTVLVCSVITTGVVLSAAGQVLAFVPNTLGQALLHNERVL